MADEDFDAVYGSKEQIDFARRMAEVLLRQRGQQMSPGMAILPGSWMYSVPDMIKYIGGAQYRDIAGIEGKKARDAMVNPDAERYKGKRYGNSITPSAAHGTSFKSAAVDPSSVPSPIPVRSVKTSSIDPYSPPVTPPPLETQGLEGEAPIPGLSDGMSTTVKPAVPDFETEVNPEVPFTPGQSKGITTGSVPPPLGPGPDSPDSDISYPTQSNLEAELDKIVNSPAHKNKSPEAKERARNALRRLTEEARGHFGRDVTVSEAIWYAQNKGTLAPNELGADPRMNLGGPETSPGAAPMGAGGPGVGSGGPAPMGTYDMGDEPSTRVAGDFGRAPTASPAGTRIIKIPGYEGPAPNAEYVETDEEIRKQLNAVDLGKAQDLIADWRKRQAPFTRPVPGGVLEITPRKGGGADYKFIQGDKDYSVQPGRVPLMPGMTPEGPTYTPIVPGGPEGSETGKSGIRGGSYERTIKDLNQVQGEASAANVLREQGLADIAEAKKAGTRALQLRNTIDEMKVTNETAWKPTGPTAAFFLKARQFLDNFGLLPGALSPSTTDAEVQKKLNTFLAQKAVGTFTDRGSNFELQSFMEANPGLANSQEGTRVLLDILGQENDLEIKRRRLADKETAETASEFSKKVTDLYEKHHITVPHEGKRVHIVPLSSAGSPEEARAMIERLPAGAWFWDPNRKMAVKKK